MKKIYFLKKALKYRHWLKVCKQGSTSLKIMNTKKTIGIT